MNNAANDAAQTVMAEVPEKYAVAETEEAEALQGAIYDAMLDYWRHLDHHGFNYDAKCELLRESVFGMVDLISEVVLPPAVV
jgi:hypothetical protein